MGATDNVEELEQQAAQELGVEIIPGTEIMIDVGNIHFAHANGVNGSVLVPHPSGNASDPLNWSRPWKIIVATSQLLYVWVLVCSALSLAPLFPLVAAEFHLTIPQVSFLTGLNILTLGFCTLLVVPLSNIFGRRPVSILFGVLVVLTNIWQALATSHSGLLAARACNGVVASTSEVIMVQVIADMFFLHERGTWMGIYFMMYFLGAFLGPIMAGNIGALHGWRSFFWLSTALSLFVTILLVFAFPETKWHRDSTNHRIVASEKRPGSSTRETTDAEADSQETDHLVGRGRPSKKQFGPVSKPDSRWISFVVRDLWAPIMALFNPIVFWAGLMLAGPADLVLLFNLTESELLGAPPYLWGPGLVGYSNFAFVVGGLVGVATAGPLSDWLARRSTVRNNGIREAEMRLPAMIPYVCFFVISHVVGAVGYQKQWPWQAIIVCGFGFSGLAVTSLPTIAIAYAIDCYKPISGEIMIIATIFKNVLGFCLTYWIFNIAVKDGWVTVYMTQFAVSMAPVVATIPLYYFGKSIRRWTRNSDLHRMESLI